MSRVSLVSSVSPAPVLIIGAGPAGLAAAACLGREGVTCQVLERSSQVGSRWHAHYERLHLHTVKQHSALPFKPWPQDAPRYPSRLQVLSYLQDYARENAIAVRHGVQVQRLRALPAAAGDGSPARTALELLTNQGPLSAKAVVVATGYNGAPHLPELPGRAHFSGQMVHSSKYQNAKPFAGQRVLVMGCGNSGAEIALDLAEQGVHTTLVVRSPAHVAQRDLFGVRPAQPTNIALQRLPLWLRDALATTAMRLAVGDLSRWGIVRPKLGPNAMMEQQGRIPMLDIGTVAAIKQGRIGVRPAVAALRQREVQFVDGRVEPVDAIVMATGYRTGLADWIEGFEAIADARGRPHRFGQETAIPGLYFVGFRNPSTGALREIALEAPRVAKAIGAQLFLARAQQGPT